MPDSWKIKRSLLSDLMSAARKVYPDEFIAMLGVSTPLSMVLSEMVVFPAEFGKTHSQLRWDLVPFDPLIVGSVHSHPSHSASPSSADLNAFSRMGKIHLILAYPFSLASFRAYSVRGKLVSIEIVP